MAAHREEKGRGIIDLVTSAARRDVAGGRHMKGAAGRLIVPRVRHWTSHFFPSGSHVALRRFIGGGRGDDEGARGDFARLKRMGHRALGVKKG